MSEPKNARGAAAEIIARWLETGDFPDRLVESDARDRPFIVEVVYGVAKWRRELEWIARRLSDNVPERPLLAYLMVGLYQAFHMSGVVDYAGVNETVEAAKQRFPQRSAGFVNAVLRRALREQGALRERLDAQSLGVRESHPDLLVRRWIKRYGERSTLALCRWNNERADIVIRVHTARVALMDYVQRLRGDGIQADPHPFRPDCCLTLSHGVRIAELPGYDEGLFAVQDPSTLVAVDLLNPRPGESVLDACAAPGGKTALIAERMEGQGRLIATDVHEDRLAVLRDNLRRTGAAFASVAQADAADPDALKRASGVDHFDAVLLDVPCTNTGVLRRRPDARWRFSLSRLAKLTAAQHALLEGAASLVRPGGRLVYSTCSLEPEEGEALLAAWLKAHPDFARGTEIGLFPPSTATDGAYAALLQRLAQARIA